MAMVCCLYAYFRRLKTSFIRELPSALHSSQRLAADTFEKGSANYLQLPPHVLASGTLLSGKSLKEFRHSQSYFSSSDNYSVKNEIEKVSSVELELKKLDGEVV